MCSRTIEIQGCSARKLISLCNPPVIKFPTLDEFLEDNESLKYHESLSLVEWSAIVQQYTEWFNWIAYGGIDSVLAPIIGTSTDLKTGLPVLYFPRFMPIAAENEAFPDDYLLIFVGMRAKALGITEKEMRQFIKQVQSACFDLCLEESDIITNPSNIGYNPNYGLKIIDYGLTAIN